MSNRNRVESVRPSRIALAVALAVATSGNAAAGLAQPSVWQRLRADPRFDDLAAMPLAQRRAFARDYGLEALLPRTEGTTRVVTNCNDGGPGSLRGTVQSAADGDVIDMSALTCGTISLSTGAIAIGFDNLTLKGPGARALTIRTTATYGRVISHFGAGALTLSGMTIEGGTISPNAPGAGTKGGCVYSSGTVNLGNLLAASDATQGAVVRNCTALAETSDTYAAGGGVFAAHGMSLSSSIVSGCVSRARGAASRAYGGGLSIGYGPFHAKYSEIDGNAVFGSSAEGGGVHAITSDGLISHTTIAGNSAQTIAGGILFGTKSGHVLEIDSSTISGNSANGAGGASLNARWALMPGQTQGSIRIESSTITANYSATAYSPGGALLAGPMQVDNSILSGNLSAAGAYDVSFDPAAAGGYNLIGTAVGTPPGAGLILNDNPGLAPLANNHGPVSTHALLPGSPAIDQGSNPSEADFDERGTGYPRVVGTRADIGAFERDPDVIFFNGFE